MEERPLRRIFFEQLVQEKTNIEAFSCKKAYTAAKKCPDKQNYDAAAVWLWIANNAAWEVWEDEGCGKQALQDADEYISRGDDNAAYLLLSYGEEIDGVHYEDDARFDEKLSALQNVQHDKIPDRWKLEEKNVPAGTGKAIRHAFRRIRTAAPVGGRRL